mgnify:FL=1
MSFVESPVLCNGDVVTVQLISQIVKCLNGSCEDGRVNDIKPISVLLECFPCLLSFSDS